MASLVLLKSMLLGANSVKLNKKKRMKTRIQGRKAMKASDKICRICNESKGDVPLFGKNGKNNLADEIFNFSGVTITETDRFSKYICQSCSDLLDGCILFRKLCQKTNSILLKELNEKTAEKEGCDSDPLPPLLPITADIKKEEPEEIDNKHEETINQPNIDVRNVENIDNSHRLQTQEDIKVRIDFNDGNNINDHNNIDDGDNMHDGDDINDEDYVAETDNGHIEDSDNQLPSPSFSDSDIWSCPACSLNFEKMTAYYRHLPKCTGKASQTDKPEVISKYQFLCETCGKTATSKASLFVHMSTHENVFPYKCDVCPYQGRTIDLLKVHKRSHLTDKPFKCTQCPKATTTSSNLAKHMRHVHSTSRPFKCNYCDKTFSYQHDMKRHMRDIHLRQGTVECDICFKKFNTKKILQGHKHKIHKIKSIRSGRLPSYLLCQMEDKNTVTEPNTQ